MKIDPAALMEQFRDESWNVQNTIRSLPGVIVIMLANQHDDGTPVWARVSFPDKTFTHASVEEWIKSKSRAGLGMSLGYLLNMLSAHDDLMQPGSADEARRLLGEHGISAATALMKDARKVDTKSQAGAKGGRGKKASDNITSFRGTSAEYLAGLIKRDHPDIQAAVERGEYRSIRAAAIAAGIVKVKTPLDQLRSAWRKANPRERATFMEEINHGR
jgi:hypothetical protein